MEKDFDLLGITAVEDKIQIGVPETVGPGRARTTVTGIGRKLAEHVSRIDSLDTNKLLDHFLLCNSWTYPNVLSHIICLGP